VEDRVGAGVPRLELRVGHVVVQTFTREGGGVGGKFGVCVARVDGSVRAVWCATWRRNWIGVCRVCSVACAFFPSAELARHRTEFLHQWSADSTDAV